MKSSAEPDRSGLYDPRVAATGYGQLSAALGGFAVTAIAVALSLGPRHHADETTFGVGLLAVGFGASAVGAALFSAISAETRLLPAHYSALMLAGLSVGLGMIATFGAFEALAAAYLPTARLTFLIVLSGMAIAIAAFVNTIVEDWYRRFGTPPATHPKNRHLAKTVAAARRVWTVGTLMTAATIVVFGCVRALVGHLSLSGEESSIVVGGCFAVIIGVALAVIRYLYEEDGPPTLRLAWATNIALAGWTGLLIFCLP